VSARAPIDFIYIYIYIYLRVWQADSGRFEGLGSRFWKICLVKAPGLPPGNRICFPYPQWLVIRICLPQPKVSFPERSCLPEPPICLLEQNLPTGARIYFAGPQICLPEPEFASKDLESASRRQMMMIAFIITLGEIM